jgi:hypothetical protein
MPCLKHLLNFMDALLLGEQSSRSGRLRYLARTKGDWRLQGAKRGAMMSAHLNYFVPGGKAAL